MTPFENMQHSLQHKIKHRAHGTVESIALTYQPYLPRIATVLVVLCALSAFLYGVFLLEAVAQAASLTSAEHQIHDISSSLSVTEGEYLAATQSLTPAHAKALGYVVPTQVSTLVIDGSANTLSFVNR